MLRAGRSGDRFSVGGEIFRTCPDRPLGPPSLLYNGYRIYSGGKERPGRDADPLPPFSAVVELYLYSSYEPYGLYRASVPVQGWLLPFFTCQLLKLYIVRSRWLKCVYGALVEGYWEGKPRPSKKPLSLWYFFQQESHTDGPVIK
jgi:hypothetical protein